MTYFRKKLAAKSSKELAVLLSDIVQKLSGLQREVRPYGVEDHHLLDKYEGVVSNLADIVQTLEDLSTESAKLQEVDFIKGYPSQDEEMGDRYFHESLSDRFFIVRLSEDRDGRSLEVIEWKDSEELWLDDAYSLREAVKKIEELVGL